ncbi:hypothetical protein [Aeromicrobium sp. IC_218]|uniref:hypothetical protein n=1 Tax=Aeromicrobium sp. IC_218 TaxID=2545468 RepID=UPI00103E6EA6|nr:hypothetical protein [Aeromicrobium sp. IC_218]TCI98684.1 hypothetical protein E0W78_09955 [Aeromicrobium sp. IC_218]
MTPSSETVPARRRVRLSTVVVGLLVLALVAVSTGWWWTSRAAAEVDGVRLLPSSLVCDDGPVPFVPAERDDERGDVPDHLPAYVVQLERADRCMLTMLVRNEGEHAVRVHDMSSYLLEKDESSQLGLLVDRESLSETARGLKVVIDSTLEPGDSRFIGLPLRRAAQPCRWGESTSWMPLGTLDVSRKGQHATVRSEGDITTDVTTADFREFCS